MALGGYSKARLARMHQVMASYVERGIVAGAVTLLSRRGETMVDTLGCQDLVRRDPMRRDTIFRIASMTKPITAVAAMILVEECRLSLDAHLTYRHHHLPGYFLARRQPSVAGRRRRQDWLHQYLRHLYRRSLP